MDSIGFLGTIFYRNFFFFNSRKLLKNSINKYVAISNSLEILENSIDTYNYQEILFGY